MEFFLINHIFQRLLESNSIIDVAPDSNVKYMYCN